MSFEMHLEGASLVIGSGGHLMSEASMSVAMAGSHVVCADYCLDDALATSTKIKERGFSAEAVELDVTSTESIEECLRILKNKDIFVRNLINGAGVNAPTPFMEIDRNEWNRILDVQLIGVSEACRIFGREMISRGSGSIINISSASANPPLSKAFVYSAAKAAVLNLTKNLAREWGTSGVRVNAIRPGFFPTKWNLDNFIDDERKQKILAHTPMHRFGLPNELGACVVWLLSDEASFVTGSEIAIDGGFSAMTI